MAPPETPQNLFSLLSARYGLNAALALLRLMDPQGTGVSKGFAGGSLAASGAQGAGALTGSESLAGAGRGLGTALGVAGTGYDISQLASNPNLSTKQKAGHSAGDLANLLGSLLIPYYGIGAATKTVADIMRRSGSPELRGTGRAIAFPALPVEGLMSVLQGDKSPRGAVNSMVSGARNTPVMGKIVNPIADLFGLGTKPTTGTGFRGGLTDIFGKAGLKGFDRADQNLYNMDPKKWASMDPKDQAAATFLGTYLGSYAPGFGQNPGAYGTQAANVLANQYGAGLAPLLKGVFQKLQITPAEAMTRFQSLKLPPELLNRLSQGSSVLFG